MRAEFMIGAFIIINAVNTAAAQFPDQFYTNGKHMDVWKVEQDRKTILWFSKEPGEKIAYRQSLVIVYNNQPDYAYYIDLGTRKFVGRYSFPQDKYSVLPEAARNTNISNIPDDAFPPLGDMPTVDQLVSDSSNQSKLIDPPPTKEHPRLKNSSWNSTFFTNNRERIRAKLTFHDNRGSYSFESGGRERTGTLNNVRYDRTNDGLFIIRGEWILGPDSGYFRFTIAPDNLNLFQGEWGRNRRIEGIWSGTRARPGSGT